LETECLGFQNLPSRSGSFKNVVARFLNILGSCACLSEITFGLANLLMDSYLLARLHICQSIFTLPFLYICNKREVCVLCSFDSITVMVIGKDDTARFQICPAGFGDTAGIKSKDEIELIFRNWEWLGEVLKDELNVWFPMIPALPIDQTKETIPIGEECHRSWVLINIYDMRKEEGGSDVNRTSWVENFL